MFDITVQGITSTRRRNIVRKMANWLLTKQLGKRINLRVIIRFETMPQTDGLCIALGDASLYKPHTFLVLIHPRLWHCFSQLTSVLAHEIIHVRQMARNELYYYEGSSIVRWQKNTMVDIEVVPYRKQPWEIEAYARGWHNARSVLKAFGLKYIAAWGTFAETDKYLEGPPR